LQCKRLLQLPLALLVEAKSPWRTAKEAIAAGAKGELPLIALGKEELISRIFRRGLEKAGMEWEPAITVSSADLIAGYVARGLGAGLTVTTPHRKVDASLRELPLKGFPPLAIGAFWAGRLSPIGKELLGDLAAVAAAR
jgi:DNA-binding transcriptional LysR family regulator